MFSSATFLLCGDINQTIYEWRGSVPETILPRYIKEFRAVQIILSQNYRSTWGLINLGERFVCNGLLNTAAPPVEYTGNDVQVMKCMTESDQADWIYKTVRSLDVQGDYSKIAVLCRSNSQCEKLAASFAGMQRKEDKNAVRFMLVDEFKLFKRREIKDILAFLRLMINRGEDTALRRVSEHYFRIHKDILDDIREQKNVSGVRLSDYISPMTHASGDYFSTLSNALKAGNVVVFDTETTGVDIYKDQIIQVAAVRVNDRAEVLEQYVEFIRPSKSVGKSENVHHFSDRFLIQNGKTPVSVLTKLAAFLHGKVVVGHNVSYDMGILSAELERNSLPAVQVEGVYDTLDISRRYLSGLANYKLGTISDMLSTAHKPSHDALEDILATADVLVTLNSRFILPSKAQRAKYYQKYLSQFVDIQRWLDGLEAYAQSDSVSRFCKLIVDTFKMRQRYQKAPARLENIDSFIIFMEETVFNRGNWKQNLSMVLEYSSLSSSELDRLSKESKKMSIITIHQAKGCEFDYIFIPSLMQYTFPSYPAIKGGKLREEARLFYVAITRAKKKLFLSWFGMDLKTGKKKEISEFINLL
jgi:DNA helicase-2/ATP-dependent DNA helicase PcrA